MREATENPAAEAQGPRSHEHRHHSLAEELHEFHDLEERGESGWTPFLAAGRVWLLVLLPVGLVMAGLAFAAYYLTA